MSLYDEDIFAPSLLEARDMVGMTFLKGFCTPFTFVPLFPSSVLLITTLCSGQERRRAREPPGKGALYHTANFLLYSRRPSTMCC